MTWGIQKVGLLAEKTTETVGTTTVYTVPASTTAMFKLMWGAESDGVNEFAFIIYLNDQAIYGVTLAAGKDSWTGFLRDGTNDRYDPDAAYVHDDLSDKLDLNGPHIPTDGAMLAPLPVDFYLDAADTIKYQIVSANAEALYFAVVGTLFDV